MIELNTLPKGWSIAKLEEVCEMYQPHTISTKQLSSDGKYWVYGANGIIGKYDKYNHEYSELLITCRGASCGSVNISKPYSWINGNAMVVRPNDANLLLLNFIEMFFRGGFNIKNAISGSAQPQITRTSLNPLEIPIPPLNEQKRILTKLEQLLTDLDKGIEYLETSKQQLKVYRQAVIKSAFQGMEEFESLNDIGSWMGGGTPSTQKKEYWNDGNILWVSSQDVKSKYIDDTERKITELAIENSSTKWIKKGSLLFVVRSGILRRIFPIAIAQQNLCVNQDIQTLNLNDNYYTEFVYWYLHGNESDIRHKCAKDGTTVESIDVQKLKKYLIPKSNLDTQIKVIHEIESRLSVCEKIEETIESSLQQAEALRLSIIKKAFEGKLVPQDHNDEPAEKFLERMRFLRQSQGKQGKEKPEKKEKVKADKEKKSPKRKR